MPPDTTFNETDSLSYDILGESKALFKIKYPEERIRYDLVARNKQDSSVIDIKVFNNSNYGTINDSLIVRLYALKAGSASVFLKAEHWDPMDCPNPSISIDMEVVK
ncbi:MAG: hypothetical protein U5K69_25310 [Balneolaceae bacterium]|nr:hypothetical protein [Balneolaceae bacterium]